MRPLTRSKVNDGADSLLSSHEEHLSNQKLIQASWKFKAIGYGVRREVIPGGGPLTGQHTISFDKLDVAVISAALLDT